MFGIIIQIRKKNIILYYSKGEKSSFHIYIIHGSIGTVIEAPSRKDGKLKVKLDNDNEKTFRLIKECDLQLYEGGPLSFSSESQTAETSFEY